MSKTDLYYEQYRRLRAAIAGALWRWECEHDKKPDAIFMSAEAHILMRRDYQLCDPCCFAVQPLYPVTGPIEPPVRERYETLYGVRVYEYRAEGIEYYFARKGDF